MLPRRNLENVRQLSLYGDTSAATSRYYVILLEWLALHGETSAHQGYSTPEISQRVGDE